MIMVARQKIRFRGRNRFTRAQEFAREFDGKCGDDGEASVVTLARDIEIKPRILHDYGIPIGPELVEAMREDGFRKNSHRDAEPPRGKRTAKE